MPPLRVIARLDIKGSSVIKGIHLEGLRFVGKPAEMAQRYYVQNIDEIIYMDAVASLYGRNSILQVVEEAARNVFVPLTVGGGIRTVEHVVSALRSGADKVAINTAAIHRPEFIREAAEMFGSQCIVLSVEAKQRGPGQWEALTDNGREKTNIDVLEWVTKAEQLGAGEILITSVDMEGTRKGFDTHLVNAVRKRVRVPIIACGGAGSSEHVITLARERAVDAVACASIFHDESVPVMSLKGSLAKAGIKVRI